MFILIPIELLGFLCIAVLMVTLAYPLMTPYGLWNLGKFLALLFYGFGVVNALGSLFNLLDSSPKDQFKKWILNIGIILIQVMSCLVMFKIESTLYSQFNSSAAAEKVTFSFLCLSFQIIVFTIVVYLKANPKNRESDLPSSITLMASIILLVFFLSYSSAKGLSISALANMSAIDMTELI